MVGLDVCNMNIVFGIINGLGFVIMGLYKLSICVVFRYIFLFFIFIEVLLLIVVLFSFVLSGVVLGYFRLCN